MASNITIVRDRQLAIRRELDRRGISLKTIAFDAGIHYSTLLSYFPDGREIAECEDAELCTRLAVVKAAA